MSKKLGLGLLALAVMLSIYYFSRENAQLEKQIKIQIHTEVTALKSKGFSVEEQKLSEKKEHFVISFDETAKIAQYLTKKGIKTKKEDIEILKGLKVGVDVVYFPNSHTSTSFDFYPISLPLAITSNIDNDAKKLLTQIEKMLEKKTFLMHVDVNKESSAFKGYMKDIDEVIKNRGEVKLVMNDMKFNGELKENGLKSVHQKLKHFSITAPDEFNMLFRNMTSNYTLTGKTAYDYKTDYFIESIDITIKNDIHAKIDAVTVRSNAQVNNGLANTTMDTKINTIVFNENQQATLLKDIEFNMLAKNLDVTAFDTLQKLDQNDERSTQAILEALQQLISKNVQFNIPNFSINNIEHNGQTLDGFKLTSSLSVDPTLDLATLETNPMAALSKVDAQLQITLSNALFSLVAQQPKAIMLMMLFQPKDVNGQKVYKVEIKDGKLFVNGMPIL